MRISKHLLVGTAVHALVLLQPHSVAAQQITSALRGEVSGENGAPVTGASVQILNTNTKAVTTATTNASGSFAATGLPIGGPYQVTISATNHPRKVLEGIFLTLGETSRLQVTLGGTPVEQVVVTGGRIVGTNATIETRGTASTFTASDIQNQPSVDRDFKDVIQQSSFAFIDPVGGGSNPPVATLNISGANPRCQNFLVDGLQQKDNFGLNLQGYPTARSPLPTDWAEQVQVAVTPYDVEYNDTCGGVINVVTKSGSNEFHGSAYYYYKDDGLNGLKYAGAPANVTKPPFDENSWGFTLSGPIIEDRIFFFAGYDKLARTEVLGNAVGPTGSGASRIAPGISQAEVDSIINISNTVYKFDPLQLTNSFTENNERFIGKLTWQINNQHRIVGTYQRATGGTLAVGGGNTSTTIPQVTLPSNWYKDAEKMTAFSFQAFSDWTDRFSTQVYGGSVKIHGGQDPLNGAAFPEIYVRVPGPNGVYNLGTTTASNNTSDDGYVRLGPDFSRHFNLLEYKNDFGKFGATYAMDDHIFKGGVEYRHIDIVNAFLQGAQSVVRFDSIADFQNGVIAQTLDTRTNATSSSAYSGNPVFFASGVAGDLSGASALFNFGIASAYLQDEWYLNDSLSIQYGLRYDRYNSSSVPALNASFTSRYGFSNQKNLDGLDVWLPRISFSYDWATDWLTDSAIKVRGGAGKYSGGFQTVWISNSYSNTGVTQLSTFGRPGAAGVFATVPTNILSGGSYNHDNWLNGLVTGPLSSATTSRNSTVNALLPSFEIPNTWRMNLGTDISFDDGMLGDGWKASLELLHMKSYDQPYWTNLRIQPSAATAPDGRILYRATFDPTNGRPDPAGNPTAVTGTDIGLGSADGGEATFLIVAAQNEWLDTGLGDFNLKFGYTHSKVTDLSPATSSTANSNYQNRASVNFNEPEVGRSDYERKHRFTLATTWTERFFDEDSETRLTIFGQRMSGQPFSYVFNGNPFGPTGGGVTARSLMYVPRVDPASGLVTATSDPSVTYGGGFNLAGFNSMLQQTGLIEYAGGIAPRNAFFGSWNTLINLGLEQEIPSFISGHKAIVSLDIFNVGNLLNKNWGRFASPSFYQAYSAATVNNLTPGGTYAFTAFTPTPATITTTRSASTWQVQLGVRYEF